MPSPTSSSASTAASFSPTVGRKWLRRTVVSLLSLACLYLGTAFLLSRFLDPEELAGWLEPRLEEALGREVAVDRVEVRFLPLGVRLSDLTLADPTGLAPTLAQASSLDLRVKLLPLIKREVQVSRLTLEGFYADLRVSDEGRSNFGDFSTRPPTGAIPTTVDPDAADVLPEEELPKTSEQPAKGREPLVLNLRSLRLVRGRVRYANAEDSLDLGLTELDLRASAQRDAQGDWLFRGETSGGMVVQKGGSAPLLDDAPLHLSFEVGAGGGFEDLQIQTAQLSLGRFGLALTGEISQLLSPVRSVSLALTGEGLPLADLVAVLPDSLRDRFPAEAEGSMAVELAVGGQLGPGQLPAITGTVGLTDGRVSLEEGPIADDLRLELDILSGNSIQTMARGTVLGGPFSLEGNATLGPGGSMDLVLQASPDLGTLPSLADLPEGVSTQGQLVSEVRITGPVGDFRELRFRGNVRAVGVRATHPSLGVPLGIPQGELRLAGTQANLQDLPLFLGEDQVLLSGELADVMALVRPDELPHFDGNLRAVRLDLPRLNPRARPDPSLTYGKVAFAKVGERPLGGKEFRAAAEELGLRRPDSLPLAGTLQIAIDTVVDNQGQMEGVRARLDFGPGFLQVTDATFRRFGGEIHTSVNLSLAPGEAAPFSFSLQVTELAAERFLAHATPLGRFVRGTISMEIDLIGTLDGFLLPDRPGLVGSGSFLLTGGGLSSAALTDRVSDFLGMEALREPSIRDWGSSFVLEEGRIRLSEARLQGAPGSPAVGGSVGLNGDLDLRSAFDLPTERLSASALDRLGIVGEITANVAQRPEVVQAILRIGGSVFDPSVEADPRAAAQTLGRAVEEEVRSEVQNQVNAQKEEAERILAEQQAEAERRIQEQKDRLRNRATGFMRGLLGRGDTTGASVPADTSGASILPDTLLPDTLMPDTLPSDTIRPDTVPPDTLRPDTLRPDTLRPDTLRPDTLQPDKLAPGPFPARQEPGGPGQTLFRPESEPQKEGPPRSSCSCDV